MREQVRRTGQQAWALLFCAIIYTIPAPAAELEQPDPSRVSTLIRDWPKPSQDAAQEMVRKYGPP